jgi:hypothetical protein
MTTLLSNREGAIYFGLIEQLIYEYVRSKYDLRIRKGEHRRADAKPPPVSRGRLSFTPTLRLRFRPYASACLLVWLCRHQLSPNASEPHTSLLRSLSAFTCPGQDQMTLVLCQPSQHRQRRPKLTLHQQQEALARRAAGEALVDIARSYAVSHSTISRL